MIMIRYFKTTGNIFLFTIIATAERFMKLDEHANKLQ